MQATRTPTAGNGTPAGKRPGAAQPRRGTRTRQEAAERAAVATGSLDRIAPARRPRKAVVAWQDWRHLTFLHWPAPPEAVRPLLPEGLALDLHRGRAWISIVPFQARHSRLALAPRFVAGDFFEVNVRTYVHCNGVPGVYFFSLDAASPLATVLARLATGLPYHVAAVEFGIEGKALTWTATRTSGHRPALRARLELGHGQDLCVPGTLDHFLLERYALYTRRLGQIWRGRIHHAPLLVRPAEVLAVEDEFVSAAGLPGYGFLPPLAHYVAGADVEFFAPDRCKR